VFSLQGRFAFFTRPPGVHAFLIRSSAMSPLLLDWRIVLVRPRNPLNIGAAARAMANFGLDELVVVAPYGPVWQETRSAVGAEEIVKSARAVSTLQEAISDVTLVVGTTTGSRRNLDRDLIPLQDFSGWLRKRKARGRAALLFGSEKTGLSNEHLSACHALVRIPTSVRCPAMNLGQAVAVFSYELARSGSVSVHLPALKVHRSQLASFQALDHVLERAARVLDAAGYLKPKTRAATLLKLRRLLLGLKLTNHDIRILGGVLAQLEWKIKV
jgi:TrmH family RNA methyltransferase